MKLSRPAYRLKRLARLLARRDNIPLHVALDRVARKEGFGSWSLLAAQLSKTTRPARSLFDQLDSGELVLLGARPGHGKTMLGIELLVESVKAGRHGWFFTLEWNLADFTSRLQTLGVAPSILGERFVFDNSNTICADYIIDRLATAAPGSMVVIDYLQLLDQKRENPALAAQVSELKCFARERNIIVACISQIDRSFDLSAEPVPGIADVRMPNTVDLTVFDRTCFLNNGLAEISEVL